MKRTTLAWEPTLPPGSRHQWGVSALLGTNHRVVGVGSATGCQIRVQTGGPQAGEAIRHRRLWRKDMGAHLYPQGPLTEGGVI